MSSRTPTYAETVRAELQRQDSLELQQRLAAGGLTEEAYTIAASILRERGEPLQVPPQTPAPSPNSQAQKRKPRSGFLGLGVLASLVGFGLLGNSATSMQYGVGVALSQLAIALIVALPIFLAFRFFTTTGRTQSLATGFNVFSAFVALVWLAFVVLRAVLPLAIQGQ